MNLPSPPQIIIFYNLESKAFSKSLTTAQEAFSLSVDGTGDTDHNHLQLSICMRYVLQNGQTYVSIIYRLSCM